MPDRSYKESEKTIEELIREKRMKNLIFVGNKMDLISNPLDMKGKYDILISARARKNIERTKPYKSIYKKQKRI